MLKILASLALMLFLVPIKQSATALNLFSSPRNKVKALLDMTQTLDAINRTNQDIRNAEKDPKIIAAHKRQQELEQKIPQLQQEHKALVDKVSLQTKQKIRELQDTLTRRTADTKQTQSSIDNMNRLLKLLDTVDKLTFKYLKFLTDMARKLGGAKAVGTSKTLDEQQKEVDTLTSLLKDSQQELERISVDPKFRDYERRLVSDLQAKETALTQVAQEISSLRQTLIVIPYAEKAESLLATLKTNVKDAGCSNIKTIADTKDENIRTCLAKTLDSIKGITDYTNCSKIKKTSTGKVQINPEATLIDLKSCASDYLTKAGK